MFKFSKLIDYATIVMQDLVRLDGPSSARAVAERTGLGGAVVSKLLKLLARRGLVASSRGPGGGYQTTLAADEVMLLEIMTAVEGDTAMLDCVSNQRCCAHADRCGVQTGLQWVQGEIQNLLSGISLQDMQRCHRGVLL